MNKVWEYYFVMAKRDDMNWRPAEKDKWKNTLLTCEL